MWCIKKNGLYLSSKTVVHEDDYWEPSEIDAQLTKSYSWVKNIEKAIQFMDRLSANSYLARKSGQFGCYVAVVKKQFQMEKLNFTL